MNKINYIKSVYGKKAFEERKTVQFGDIIIVGWYIKGYPNLKDLESNFTDREILNIHNQIEKCY